MGKGKQLAAEKKQEIYDVINKFMEKKPTGKEWTNLKKELAKKYNITERSVAIFRSIHREYLEGVLNKRSIKAWKNRKNKTKMMGIPFQLYYSLLGIGKTIGSDDVNTVLRTLIASFKSDSRMTNYFKTLEQLKDTTK